ncbi:hypothetical protein ABEX55_22845, partial [Priestia endophytica]|uniref:hypothetical protein n=1 Tax=Priestia endophytica TaxID=135735 RepID=UPI003D271C4A
MIRESVAVKIDVKLVTIKEYTTDVISLRLHLLLDLLVLTVILNLIVALFRGQDQKDLKNEEDPKDPKDPKDL